MESGVPSKLLPTNPENKNKKNCEQEYMAGDEFHSLAVVAFPLSSISPVKYPPSNNRKKDKRTNCDKHRSKQHQNLCHTVQDSNESFNKSTTVQNNDQYIDKPLVHSFDCKYHSQETSGQNKMMGGSSKNTSLPISCESMSLFDGVTVKIQYIEDDGNDFPVTESKSDTIQKTKHNIDNVRKNVDSNVREISKKCEKQNAISTLNNERLILSTSKNECNSKETNDKSNPNNSQIKAETNSTLSYLHDISLRKPTCDLTIPLRQPLSANYREQKTRGKCSPVTNAPFPNMAVNSNFSFHDCKDALEEETKQNNNGSNANNFFNLSKMSKNGAYIIRYESNKHRSGNIKGCGNDEHKRNPRLIMFVFERCFA